jgi:predicted Zn-dependent protease
MIKTLIAVLIILVPTILEAQEIDLLILNNEYNKALQIIDSELTKEKAQPMLYLKKGIILQKRFDFTGAVKSLERAWQLDSLNSKILNEIGEVNSNLGDQ